MIQKPLLTFEEVLARLADGSRELSALALKLTRRRNRPNRKTGPASLRFQPGVVGRRSGLRRSGTVRLQTGAFRQSVRFITGPRFLGLSRFRAGVKFSALIRPFVSFIAGWARPLRSRAGSRQLASSGRGYRAGRSGRASARPQGCARPSCSVRLRSRRRFRERGRCGFGPWRFQQLRWRRRC
jgi:hypothetical protein